MTVSTAVVLLVCAALPGHSRAQMSATLTAVAGHGRETAAGPGALAGADAPEQLRTAQAWRAADAAYKSYAHGRYLEAAAQARLAASLAPANPDYQRLLATAEIAVRTATKQQAYDAASSAYQAAARHDYRRELSAAREAVRLAPGNRAYRSLLIDALTNTGAVREAETAMTDVLAYNADDGPVLAQRGFLRQRLGQLDAAAADLTAALKAGLPSPDQRRTASLGLADTALAANQPERALAALAPYREERTYPVASRLTLALVAAGRKQEALAAATDAAQLAPAGEQRAMMIRIRIGLFLDLGHLVEARKLLAQARAAGELPPTPDLAYFEIRAGEDREAAAIFQQQADRLSASAKLDAAYAAKRSAQNQQALHFYKLAIDDNAQGTLPMQPQALFNVRRDAADLYRDWGAFATLSYGAVGVMPGSPLAPPPSAGHMLQAGTEVYWRPPVIGNRDGTRFELFGRMFENLVDERGGTTGAPSLQGGAGARWKPFSAINLVLEGARLFRIGQDARNDWLGRLAFSEGRGTDLRVDAPTWTMWQVYAEYDRFIQIPETVASFELRLGRSIRADAVSSRLVATPFLAFGGNFDSAFRRTAAVGTGPGLNLRYWFRETKYAAPMSYIDLNLQYRFRVAGDDRARGVFVGFTVAF